LIIQHKVIYYTKPSGQQPVAKWRDKREKHVRADIDAKRRKLEERGLGLLKTEMFDKLSGDSDFYELRNVSLGWRIAVYFDRNINTFVLLHGFKKQKSVQPQDIEQARRLLYEYLATRRG
jgi:putative component of toxin-antitoxin plasmid stabilization module